MFLKISRGKIIFSFFHVYKTLHCTEESAIELPKNTKTIDKVKHLLIVEVASNCEVESREEEYSEGQNLLL